MPVIVDRRGGSVELIPALSKKVPVIEDTLDAGDFAFEGWCADGRKLVGIERKKLSDMLDCIMTGRFSGHQLIGMVDTYASRHLILEGKYRADKDTGVLQNWAHTKQNPKGCWMSCQKGSRLFFYKDLSHFLMTIAMKTGTQIWRTNDEHETVQLVADLHSWFEKPWDAHRSHLAIHSPIVARVSGFKKPPMRRMIAKELPAIGWDRSSSVAHGTEKNPSHFETTWDMVHASVTDWEKIEGIGRGIAENIYRKIRTE